jgi:outer membrane protein assembly factor BamB
VYATTGPAAAAPAGAAVVFHLSDPRIGEASGIATGIASPGVIYVQNDSGDDARFFALDARTGKTLATYTVPGATNVDWEDIAVAPDARRVASVWLADIGDNSASRTEIAVYRVDEPHVDGSATDVVATTGAPEVWRLRYPGTSSDAESLAVSPQGTAYLFTKSLSGTARVYALPARSDGSLVQALGAVGSVHLGFTGTVGGPNQFGQRTVTGAALSRDGTMLAVRTYTDAYVWRVAGSDVAAAIKAKPVRLALPAQPLGEGIAFDGARLLIDSEGAGSAVYALAVPQISTTATPTAAPTAPASVAPTKNTQQTTPAPPSSQKHYPLWAGIGAGLLVIAMVFVMYRLTGPDRRQARRDRRRDRQWRRSR